jgi:hypothetical protein
VFFVLFACNLTKGGGTSAVPGSKQAKKHIHRLFTAEMPQFGPFLGVKIMAEKWRQKYIGVGEADYSEQRNPFLFSAAMFLPEPCWLEEMGSWIGVSNPLRAIKVSGGPRKLLPISDASNCRLRLS